MKRRTSRYTPDFKLRVLLALEANGGSLDRTAASFNVPKRTILDWNRQREQIVKQVNELHNRDQALIAARIDLSLRQLLNSLPEKIETAKLTDSLRAIAMLNTLRSQMITHDYNSTAAREQLANMLVVKMSEWEDSISDAGGHAQLAALNKAREEVSDFIEANDVKPPW